MVGLGSSGERRGAGAYNVAHAVFFLRHANDFGGKIHLQLKCSTDKPVSKCALIRAKASGIERLGPPAARDSVGTPKPIAYPRMRQTLQGSLSAVSKPNCASKSAFESTRRDLHNALLCTAPQSQFFIKMLSKHLQNSAKINLAHLIILI